MNDVIVCPACERKVQLPREYLGRSVQCPECRHTFLAGDPATSIVSDDGPAVPSMPAALPPRYPAHYEEDEPYDDWGVRRPQLRHDHGGVVLALGIISIVVVCFGPILGPIAFFLGSSDLRAIDRGEMETHNRSMVQAGRIIGACGFCLSMFYVLIYAVWFGFLFTMH
jgi:hypothetical protein